MIIELIEPIQTAGGRWIVAIWLRPRRPDVTPCVAVPVYVPIEQWVPSGSKRFEPSKENP